MTLGADFAKRDEFKGKRVFFSHSYFKVRPREPDDDPRGEGGHQSKEVPRCATVALPLPAQSAQDADDHSKEERVGVSEEERLLVMGQAQTLVRARGAAHSHGRPLGHPRTRQDHLDGHHK